MERPQGETELLQHPPLLPSIEVLSVTGRPDLAEVFVGRFADGREVEFVDAVDPDYPKEEKWVINVSTQFGCPVGCPYCDAGSYWKGNLTPDQLMAQIHHVLDRNPKDLQKTCAKLKVHFSRMGEPALNDAVLVALDRLRLALPWSGLWGCLATTAPRNRQKWFASLRDIKNRLYPGRFQLQFSVNSTSEEARKHLIPISHWSLEEIAEYGRTFWQPGDRKVGLNFALAQDVPFDPAVITNRFDPQRFAVKLTPINPTATGIQNGFATVLRSDAEDMVAPAIDALQRSGFDVIVSIGDPGEDEIGSNCGQAVRALHDRDA